MHERETRCYGMDEAPQWRRPVRNSYTQTTALISGDDGIEIAVGRQYRKHWYDSTGGLLSIFW